MDYFVLRSRTVQFRITDTHYRLTRVRFIELDIFLIFPPFVNRIVNKGVEYDKNFIIYHLL